MPCRIEDICTKTHALGVVNNKPKTAYRNVQYLNPSTISSGFVDHVEIDPAAIKWTWENPGSGPSTAAAQDRMDRGTLAHLMLLQPERLLTDVAVYEGAKRAGDDWNSFQSMHHGKLIMRRCDYDAVSEACKVFMFEPRVRELLTDLDVEVAMFSREHSFYVKGMVDAITRGDRCKIIDLKTTEAGFSFKAVETTIRNMRYREKMAAYKRWFERESGREVTNCFNLFLNMVPGHYAVRICEMTSDAEDWGEKRIVAALDQVQRCLDANKWPTFVREDMVMVADWERDSEVCFEGIE